MATPIVNFGLVTVSTGYTSGATSVVLQSGHGSRLPSTVPYPVTWWNSTDYAHPADDPNKEIVSVTARSSDTLTIVRAREGTSATNKNTAAKTYRMSLGLTKAITEELRIPKNTHQGLQLQTHGYAQLALSSVEIVDVEYIIFDDGTESRNDNGEWNGLYANIDGSGDGGLDTGTEVSSTWYEIYGIAKEDGTRKVMLHRSKSWATEASYTTSDDATQGVRAAADHADNKVAQGFKLANSGNLIYVEAPLLKVGAPSGYYWFTVESDSGGTPSGTALATSQIYDAARLTPTATWVRVAFNNIVALSASPTQYHLVLQGNWTTDASNYVGWRMDGSAGSYANGSKALYDSDTGLYTTDTDDDLLFTIGIERNNGAVIMPADYTKKCHLGWVWNNAAGNFEGFLQVGRSRRSTKLTAAQNRVAIASGTPERIDLSSYLPPRRTLKTLMGFAGTGTGGGVMAIGDLRATDISYLDETTGAMTVLSAGLTGTRPSTFSEVFVQTGAIMTMGTQGGALWISGFDW